MSAFEQQLEKVRSRDGFIAALDQSGGSTPKALRLYGVEEDAYDSDAQMFDLVHAMRTRIMTSPGFNGDRILGAILFENTLDRTVESLSSATYLWDRKGIVPFLKVDKGLAEESDGAQLMKPIPELTALLAKAKSAGVFGTKMRSVIKRGEARGVADIVEQQFDIGRQICDAGLIPIIEPEVDINSSDKAACEIQLREQLMAAIGDLDAGQQIMLKLTLPEEPDFYRDCIEHSNVLRVVALSGGYSRQESNRRVAENHGMIASFSRALTEGLSASQSDDEFNELLDKTIESIFQASKT